MKIWKIAQFDKDKCLKCRNTLYPDLLGDGYCRNCKIRVTFQDGYPIGIKPLDWMEEEWDEYQEGIDRRK